ncbi:hypothetical protein KM043_005736 [Ampulex compressa]|nr:hypothetical protein KM043_005736 [Ampulex compressa]
MQFGAPGALKRGSAAGVLHLITGPKLQLPRQTCEVECAHRGGPAFSIFALSKPKAKTVSTFGPLLLVGGETRRRAESLLLEFPPCDRPGYSKFTARMREEETPGGGGRKVWQEVTAVRMRNRLGLFRAIEAALEVQEVRRGGFFGEPLGVPCQRATRGGHVLSDQTGHVRDFEKRSFGRTLGWKSYQSGSTVDYFGAMRRLRNAPCPTLRLNYSRARGVWKRGEDR